MLLQSLASTTSVSFVLVFLEGILSFFSPCVLPLIPIYMGYLAGSGKNVKEDGTIQYDRKKVFFQTLFFVLGISAAFFILGLSFSSLGRFFQENRMLITRIGGILIIILGLFQLGIFEFRFLQRERKLHLDLGDKKVTPIMAFVMGFTFSFAWTPCVGPALSSVLIMASSAKTALTGNLLVFVYALGFVLPFLALGLFTTQALTFLKKKQKLLKYTVKAGGVLLVIIGLMTFTGYMNGVSSYLNSFKSKTASTESEYTTSNPSENETSQASALEDPSPSAAANNTEEAKPAQNSTSPETTAPADHATTSDNVPTDAVASPEAEPKNTDSPTATEPPSIEEDTPKNTPAATEEAKKDPADTETPATETPSDTEENKDVIPAFDFTLVDQNGTTHTLSDYKGKVVFLNFWATWCGPCQVEMPHIEELYKEFNFNKDDVVFLGVTNPRSAENPNASDEDQEYITKFLADKGYTFPTVFDTTGEVFGQYFISAFPTTFMIDKKGNIYGYVPGSLTKDIMSSIISETLDASK